MSRPAVRPTVHQRDELGKQALKSLVAILAAWPRVVARVHDYTRGYPAAGGIGGGGDSDGPTPRQALAGWREHSDGTVVYDPEPDPAAELRRWVSETPLLLRRLFDHADEARTILDPPPEPRRNTVEVCAECNLPSLVVKRVDGQPYCLADYERLRRRA